MPFAFSTLGCPDYTLDEVLDLAVLKGVDGLELRAAPGAIVSVESTPAERSEVRAAFEDSGVRLLALSSYLRACDPGDDAEFVRDAEDHVRLAGDLGAACIRVFPGSEGPAPEGDVRAVRRLAAAAPIAAEHGVTLALETHDSHRRGAQLAPILRVLDEQLPGHGIGVIWDAHHPWRSGEAPDDTLRELAPWLSYVQVKDADAGESGRLREIGDGVVPLDEIAGLLADRRDLWWSLEWEKLWHPELVDLPVALGSAQTWYRDVVCGCSAG